MLRRVVVAGGDIGVEGGGVRDSRARMMWWSIASWEARAAKWARAMATKTENSGGVGVDIS
jgi:hypothetical protein